MKRNKQQYTFIDLFAGLGGFHIAMQELGCKCVFASELKDDLRKLYEENYPGARIEGDITKIAPSDIPPHDILCAGFPCQPFSQAGKQQGFNDDKQRGNLFDYICAIVQYHRPKYIFLENVSNLKGHDHGNTWAVIHQRLEDLEYDVPEPAILSPHQFGWPQHRKRIYIVAVDQHRGGIGNFKFPSPTNKKCDLRLIIDESDPNYIHLKQETRNQLDVWQRFIDETIAHGHEIPRFPIWAMEFGATYDYKGRAPYFQTRKQLEGKRGNFGQPVQGNSKDDYLLCLPIYAQDNPCKRLSDQDHKFSFPDWKIQYITQNRKFYQEHQDILQDWIREIQQPGFENSHQKLEWNCGPEEHPDMSTKIIQFRASGIRVKLPTYSPALVLNTTQIPIIPWITTPKGEHGRYMTRREAAKLQCMEDLHEIPDTIAKAFRAFGNAVNVEVVRRIAENLIPEDRR